MKTFIFLIVVLTLSHIHNADDAFSKISTALANFRDSITREQVNADARHKKEAAWCSSSIAAAVKVLDQRTQDVNDVKAHIAYLQNEQSETNKTVQSRLNRIAENNRTLERFKQERCNNNLNFIKSLREHKDAIDVMKLLRADLVTYFNTWLKNPENAALIQISDHESLNLPMFMEKLTRFAHLFDDEHREVFIQLMEAVKTIESPSDWKALNNKTAEYTSVSDRNQSQIGTGHIDNTRGELKRLESPAFQKARQYVLDLQTKVLAMLDGLIKHLQDSRRKLSEDEMLANEHFADFQSQMIKENKYLVGKIKVERQYLLKLAVQLTESQAQYKRRETLRQEAEDALKTLRKICQEKEDFHAKESARRTRELAVANKAILLLKSIIAKLTARVMSRVSTNVSGGKYAKNDLSSDAVVGYKPTADTSLTGNLKVRSQVVL